MVELSKTQGGTWQAFKMALKEEYFLEDEGQVTKQSFLKWVKQRNKGLNAPALLREFEKRFEQLSAREQTSLEGEKVELFVEAADAALQRSLVKDLEDLRGELGLTNAWRRVPKVVNLIVKRQKRSDKLNVILEEEEGEIASPSHTPKGKQEEILEDVTKQLRELRLNYKKVDELLTSMQPPQSSQRQVPQRRQGVGPQGKQCIWCDAEDHITTQECNEFNEAVAKNLVY